jgi:hypothetical protein
MISPYQGVSLRRMDNGVAVMRIHYSADLGMTPEKIAALKHSYIDEAAWRQEMEIEYEAKQGERLFPSYAAHVNDCEPFDCTDTNYWTIYQGCDPHGRTPHGFVWTAFGSSGDVCVWNELFKSPLRSVKEYSETIHWLESDADDKPYHWWPGQKVTVFKRIMDTHGSAVNSDEGEDYFRTYRKYKLNFFPAKKGHDILATARDEINRLMLPQKVVSPTGKVQFLPQMYVSTACPQTKDQLENVRFPSGEAERLSDERPETFVRHLVDPLCYIFTDRPRFVARKKWESTEEPIYANTGY